MSKGVIVKEWKYLNQKLLDDTIQIFKARSFNYIKLNIKVLYEQNLGTYHYSCP